MAFRGKFNWEVVRAYAKGKTTRQIADHFGISFKHCMAYIKKHNIECVKRYDAMAYLKKYHNEIVELFSGGATERGVAIKYKVATATIRVYMRKNGISRQKKPVEITKPILQPNCWVKSENVKLPPIKLMLRKLKVYPLPEAGQCKFYNDNMELCPNSIDSGVYCQEHNKICYVNGVKNETK